MQNQFGNTALMLAATRRNTQTIEMPMQFEMSKQNNFKITALMLCIRNQNYVGAKMLVNEAWARDVMYKI
jgi:hypothetical protein